MQNMPLTDLDANKTAFIKEIQGGHMMVLRLTSMGIRPGVKITKISSHFWRGPVTVRIGKTKVAIGYAMAQRILLEEHIS